MNISTGLTFDDVLLVPQHSEVATRKNTDVSTSITPLRKLDMPIIAANMNTVCGSQMAVEMARIGGLGVLHRYLTLTDQVAETGRIVAGVQALIRDGEIKSEPTIAVAVGVNGDYLDRVRQCVEAGADLLVLDIAHGDSVLSVRAIQAIKALGLVSGRTGLPVELVAGNIATRAAAERLLEAGADALKVGVGPGSMCTTRIVTGHGVPQLTAILEVAKVTKYAIADGGIRYAGDIVKALAVGASSVMAGSLLAGTSEAPGEVMELNGVMVKRYQGMASFEAQTEFFGKQKEQTPEGVARTVPLKGPVATVIGALVGGLRSGLSYSGSTSLEELRKNAQFIQVTAAGQKESGPHGLYS